MTEEHCNQIHICSRCRKELPPCQLEGWLCPWINEDENTECLECEKLTTEEMYKFSNKE